MPAREEATAPPPVLLAGGRAGSGEQTEVLLTGGVVVASGGEAGQHPLAGGAARLELDGFCLLPAAAEPHAHLDKAFIAGRARDSHGDVRLAVRAVMDAYDSMTPTDLFGRARRVAAEALRHGITAIRSHVDVGGGIATRALDALVELRAELGGLLDLQLVALPVQPVSGPEGAEGRRWLCSALERGADAVGGAPWLDPEPERAVQELTAVAASEGRHLDLHMDETTDVDVLTLTHLVERVQALGLGGRVTASHCVSLGQQAPLLAHRLAEMLASAGIAVVALPQTNLYLQGRASDHAVPRGLPPIALLEAAGVLVAAGGDNYRDPFNPLGRVDPLETAALLVAAGHLGPAAAYRMVSEAARAVMGLGAAALAAGDAADLVAVRASDVAEAVACGTEERLVFRAGRIVARSELRISGALWP